MQNVFVSPPNQQFYTMLLLYMYMYIYTALRDIILLKQTLPLHNKLLLDIYKSDSIYFPHSLNVFFIVSSLNILWIMPIQLHTQ